MDLKDRAWLVRALLEEKRAFRKPEDPTERDRNFSGYLDRVNRGGNPSLSAGDGGIYASAARWDRFRNSSPSRRRRLRRAPRDPGGYVGYTGDYRSHFRKPNAGRIARSKV